MADARIQSKASVGPRNASVDSEKKSRVASNTRRALRIKNKNFKPRPNAGGGGSWRLFCLRRCRELRCKFYRGLSAEYVNPSLEDKRELNELGRQGILAHKYGKSFGLSSKALATQAVKHRMKDRVDAQDLGIKTRIRRWISLVINNNERIVLVQAMGTSMP